MKILLKKYLFCALMLVVFAGCGDDSDHDQTERVQVSGEPDAGEPDASVEDTGTADADQPDTTPAPDATSDAADSSDVTPGDADRDTSAPQPELHTQQFFGSALTLISGASLRMPFELSELTTDIEFFVVRELRGYNEVQNREGGQVVMTVNSASFVGPETGWVRDPLPRGDYDVYLENLGGASGSDVNEYTAAKVIESPSYDPEVATFESTVVELSSFADPGVGLSSEFTVRANHRYILRGVRGKNTIFVVPADQIPLIEQGQAFNFAHRWNESDPEIAPEPTELDVEAGDYVLIAVNNAGDDRTHGSVIAIDEWQMQ